MMVDELGTIPDMLHWYDGMLLLPEHFQAAHRRQEMLGGYLARTVAPHGWGVKTLDVRIVDESRIEVVELEAVMPDGLVIRYHKDHRDDEPLSADLGEMLKGRRALTVHLTATAWSSDITAQDGREPGGLDRYRSVVGAPLERDDPYHAESDAAAERMRERPWLRPNLGLYVAGSGLDSPPAKLDSPPAQADSPPSKYVALPIARVVQNPDSKIVLGRYEPPRPTIAGAELLKEVAQNVVTGLRDREKFLGEKVQRDRAKPAFAATGTAVDAQIRQLVRQLQGLQRDSDNLRALVRTVPRLEGLLADGSAHPFTLYLALCDVVGDLALLGNETYLPKVPQYEHRDALASYEELERHIQRMLDLLAQRYRILRFERTEAGRFELAFAPSDLGETLIVGAERSKDESERTIRTWMAHAVIATGEQMSGLKPKRISGQVRVPIEHDEDLDLSAPRLTSLFRIDPSAEYIDRNGSVLVIENKDSDGPTSILLYVARDLPAPERGK